MKIVVDRELCIGSGMCTTIAPSVFELSPEGELVLIHGDELEPSEIAAVEDAVACCPVEALLVRDDASTEEPQVARG